MRVTPCARSLGRFLSTSAGSALVIVSLSLTILLQVLNAGGVLFERGAGLYTAGLWLLLLVCFLVLVPLAPSRKEQ